MHHFLATAGLLSLGLVPGVSWAKTMTAQECADF